MDRILLKDAIVYTGKCKFLTESNLCSVYKNRFKVNPICRKVDIETIQEPGWPVICGLRVFINKGVN
jgi:uncharacterized cysteine cluster protein YcgN (CxxCxxCC family)